MNAPRTLCATAAFALLAAGAINAQDGAPALPGNASVARVEAGVYEADSSHSVVAWEVDHFGFNPYPGLFGDVSGTLRLDPANLSATSVDVSVPVASVMVASEGLKNHLLRPGKDGGKPDFFGADPAPARFVSTSVTPTGGTSANIMGDLTLNGVTQPVTVMAEFTGAGANPMNKKQTVGFTGQAFIDREQFGIDYALPMVGQTVALDITVAFEKTEAIAGSDASNPCGASSRHDGHIANASMRAAIAQESGAETIRWLYPDSIVTKDLRRDRLNVMMEKGTDRITRMYCG